MHKPVKQKTKPVKQNMNSVTNLIKKPVTHQSVNSTMPKHAVTHQSSLTPLENELLRRGTIKDKIDTLTLLVKRDPSRSNFKRLLSYTEGQRNDTVYYTLKNIKELILDSTTSSTSTTQPTSTTSTVTPSLIHPSSILDLQIKQKIIKTFEMNLRNEFIKKKVIKLVYEILKQDKLFLELIFPFINKLGDKKEMSEYVEKNLLFLYYIREEVILDSLEDFYFKNSLFRTRLVCLKFLSKVAITDKKKGEEIYKKIFEDAIKGRGKDKESRGKEKETRQDWIILLEYITDGLLQYSTSTSSTSSFIPLLLDSPSALSEKLVLNCLRIIRKQGEFKAKFIEVVKKGVIKKEKEKSLLLLLVEDEKDEDIIKCIIDSCYTYPVESVLFCLLLLERNKKTINIEEVYTLRILHHHYSPLVRETVRKIVGGEGVEEFNPFDKMEVEIMTSLV